MKPFLLLRYYFRSRRKDSSCVSSLNVFLVRHRSSHVTWPPLVRCVLTLPTWTVNDSRGLCHFLHLQPNRTPYGTQLVLNKCHRLEWATLAGAARQTADLLGWLLRLSSFLNRGGSQEKLAVFEVTDQNSSLPTCKPAITRWRHSMPTS